MEITESHIEFAKRELRKNESIPGVAGSLMNRTPKEAEFSDLVAIANRAQMELKNEQDNNGATNSTGETPVDEASSSNPDERTDGSTHEEPQPASTDTDKKNPVPAGVPSEERTGDSEPSPVDVDGIAGQSDDQGASSWKK